MNYSCTILLNFLLLRRQEFEFLYAFYLNLGQQLRLVTWALSPV